ncbi:MAG: hypothetical protein C4534_06865 [Gaiellales bacterium]|nr:MAG: hypothetical protein C4534_06865 [Gaiellales bacterium]
MKLTSNKEIQKARDAYFSVFRNRSPYHEPFHENTPARALVYPVETYPDDDLYFAIANAAAGLGEDEAYFSTIMDVTEDSYFAVDYWKLDLDEYPFNEKGMKENGWIAILESTIYSTEGSWGVILTNRQFGLVGGSNPFLDSLRNWIPDLDAQAGRFVDFSWYGREGPGDSSAWLAGLLAHIYGEEKGAAILRGG